MKILGSEERNRMTRRRRAEGSEALVMMRGREEKWRDEEKKTGERDGRR